jgi:hypothetical protein
VGLPRCAKLGVCKHSSIYANSSYAASDARNFKENFKNLKATIFKGVEFLRAFITTGQEDEGGGRILLPDTKAAERTCCSRSSSSDQ